MKKILNKIGEKMGKITPFLNRYSLVFHYLLACIICLFAETVSRHSFLSACSFVVHSPFTFMYNALIIFVTFLGVYFFKRRALVRVFISTVWCFLGIINGCVLAERVTPFGFTDLKLVSDLFAMQSTYFTPLMGILAIGGVSLFIGLCIFLFKNGPVYRGKMHRVLMLLIVASCFLWFPMVTNAAVNNDVLTDYFDNIAQGYERYGFVYGFSSSVVNRGMDKPENYSEEAVKEVLHTVSENMISENKLYRGDSYVSAVSSQVNESVSANSIVVVPADPSDPDSPNIILVLLESFVDPTEINFLKFSEDPVPNFHRLESEFSTGYLEVPVVGAGTANTEFEVLTGMSMKFFGTGEYPYKTILKTNSCESTASVLADIGYGTHVVHNNKAKFYSRNNAFAKMGFDTFTSREFMNIQEYNPLGSWPTDHILIQEVSKSLDATPDQSDFVYTITVQGHGAYPTEKVFDNPEIQISGNDLTEESFYQWEYYVNEIHEVDKFIGDLTQTLSERNEKTLVVMFGDHLPTMNLENENMKSGDIFKTKYITWNNFGMAKQDSNITAYQLMADMTDRIGIHEGTLLSYHQSQNADLQKENEQSYIDGLNLLQYDVLYGERYAYNQQDLYPETNLEMGLKDAVVSSAYIKDGFLYVRGSDFTPWSKVFINGDGVKTRQISTRCLQVELTDNELETGDEIIVNQCSGDTSFRSSNSIIFE